MARMPGAIWKPLAADWDQQPRMKAYDFFCLHTMVGGLSGTDDFFRNKNGVGYGGTESHFGVGPDGTIYQWQDTDFQADANADGNWHVISSENADTGAPFPPWAGSDVPAMTPEQVEANARIAAWLWNTHRIPVELAPNSKPGSRGLAVHRYGVPGYMPAGAERWSTSQGKACPGDRRIAQAPQVSARAKQILNGDDDMPYTQKQLEDFVYGAVRNLFLDMFNGDNDAAKKVFTSLVTGAVTEPTIDWGTAGKISVAQQTANNAKAIAALAAKVDALGSGTSAGSKLPTEFDLSAVARAVADELDRRAHDGDAATGPIS